MEDIVEEMISDFAVGDDVIISMDVSPFTIVGRVKGYSEFLPGLMILATGAMDNEKTVSKQEEAEIRKLVIESEIDELMEFVDDPEGTFKTLAWIRQVAHRLDVPDVDDVLKVTNEYRGLVEEATANLIASKNEDYRTGNVFTKYAAPIKTYIPSGCIVRMELMQDSLRELDLMEFDESLEDTLKQMMERPDAN